MLESYLNHFLATCSMWIINILKMVCNIIIYEHFRKRDQCSVKALSKISKVVHDRKSKNPLIALVNLIGYFINLDTQE